MRILFVINGLGTGGAERSLAEMIGPLTQAGVQALIVCLYHRTDGVEARVIEDGHDVRFLTANHLPGRVLQLRALIRAFRADVVHTTIFQADLCGRFAAVGTSARVVTSLVNTTYDAQRMEDPSVARWKIHLVRLLDGWTARHLTHHFHAITHSVAQSAQRSLGLDPDKIDTVLRGRDEARLGRPSPGRRARTRQLLGIAPETPVVLNVGRQEFQKGHAELFEAFAAVLVEEPDAILVQAGRPGHATGRIMHLVEELGLADSARLLGHRDDVSDLLSAADVFVFPSHYEGLGGALIEAMALGLPIVTTRVPAILEVIDQDRNARVVDVGDSRALGKAILEVLRDAQLRADFARRSRQLFEERFTLTQSVRGMLELYESSLPRS